jgi:hypothetical protein
VQRNGASSRSVVRAAARVVREHETTWTIDDPVALTDRLIRDPHLEVKRLGIEALGTRRRELGPRVLITFKRWLADGHASNWATTDSLCSTLVAPLLHTHPRPVAVVASWAVRNVWVRRAAAVSLVRLAARGVALDTVYDVATALRRDRADLEGRRVAAAWSGAQPASTPRAVPHRQRPHHSTHHDPVRDRALSAGEAADVAGGDEDGTPLTSQASSLIHQIPNSPIPQLPDSPIPVSCPCPPGVSRIRD